MKRLALRFFSTFALLSLLFLVPSCHSGSDSTDLVGNWVNRYSFNGVARSHAVTFTIGDYAYVVGGYDGDARVRLKDAWKFDPVNNVWTSIKEFPGIGRTNAVAFAANGKGYVGLGYDGSAKLKDFYEYDPTSDTWTPVADFGGTARYGSIAFSVGGKGYIVGGYDGNYLKDVWEYDPTSGPLGTWVEKSGFSGNKRRFGMSFVINDVAYVVGGENNDAYVKDFWAYNASTDTWAQKRSIYDYSDQSYDDDYTTIVRENASTFVIDGLGYLATGDIGSLVTAVWEYDPVTDLWTTKTTFTGAARNSAIGITVQNRGFVLLGKSSSSSYFDDVWEFKPFEANDDSDDGN